MSFFRLALLLLVALPHCARAQDAAADPELNVSGLDGPIEIHERVERNNEPLPLLPMIFFDEPGGTAIPERYHRFADHAATGDYVDTAALHVATDGKVKDQLLHRLKYYEILDIIGYRLSRNPGVAITLRGGYAAEPGESAAVATARAEAVRSYLTTVWKIPAKRITIAKSSRESEPGDNGIGHAEARRVAIETKRWDLFSSVRFPVVMRSVLVISPRIVVMPNMPADDIASVEIVVTGAGRTIGRAVVPPSMVGGALQRPFIWTYASREPSIGFDTIRITAHITGRDGVVRRSNDVVRPVRIVRKEFDMTASSGRIPWLRIPFFSYRDSILSSYQKHLIDGFIDRYGTEQVISPGMPWHFEISERAVSHDSLMRMIGDVYWLVDDSIVANRLPWFAEARLHPHVAKDLSDEIDTLSRMALVALHGRMLEGRFEDSYDLSWHELPQSPLFHKVDDVEAYLRTAFAIERFSYTLTDAGFKAEYSYSPLPEGRLYDRIVTLGIY